ncbi:MAG: hypothetical protein ACREOO_20040 [bacterium]
MLPSRKKIFVIALLLLTGSLQGWPLLVAAQCSMLAAPESCEMKSACCCDQTERAPTVAYARCNSGKKLSGVLSTDPSVLSAKEKNGKSQLACVCGTASLAKLFVEAASPTPIALHPHASAGHHLVPAVFLLDCVFRI